MVSLKFHATNTHEIIEIEANGKNIQIVITNNILKTQKRYSFDKITSVKISKELRKQIALLF